MRSYSVAEAKDHFEEMLEHVRAGETVAVTQNGEPLAELTPAGVGRLKSQREDLRREVRQLFKGVTLDDLMSARHEGHKY